jgi:hypothetical protein
MCYAKLSVSTALIEFAEQNLGVWMGGWYGDLPDRSQKVLLVTRKSIVNFKSHVSFQVPNFTRQSPQLTEMLVRLSVDKVLLIPFER